MKKLILVLISVGILTACGDSFRSIKVKDFANLLICRLLSKKSIKMRL